jgi:hypothetical protein
MNYMKNEHGVIHAVRGDLPSSRTVCDIGTVEQLELREVGEKPTCAGCLRRDGATTWHMAAGLNDGASTLVFDVVTPTGRRAEAFQCADAYLAKLGYEPADYTLTEVTFV